MKKTKLTFLMFVLCFMMGQPVTMAEPPSTLDKAEQNLIITGSGSILFLFGTVLANASKTAGKLLSTALVNANPLNTACFGTWGCAIFMNDNPDVGRLLNILYNGNRPQFRWFHLGKKMGQRTAEHYVWKMLTDPKSEKIGAKAFAKMGRRYTYEGTQKVAERMASARQIYLRPRILSSLGHVIGRVAQVAGVAANLYVITDGFSLPNAHASELTLQDRMFDLESSLINFMEDPTHVDVQDELTVGIIDVLYEVIHASENEQDSKMIDQLIELFKSSRNAETQEERTEILEMGLEMINRSEVLSK